MHILGYDGTGMLLQPGESKRFLIRAGHGTFGSGTTALAVDTSGNVGIGTVSPQALLHVEGALSASGQITSADIIPVTDDTEFLGGTANRWRVLYATRVRTDILREADGTNVLGMTSSTRDLYGLDGNVRISFEDDIIFTNGDLVIPEYIYHSGDTNTFIRFQPDDINLTAGGNNLFRVDGGVSGTPKEIVVNEAGADTDFRVESDSVTAALFVTGSTGNVGIGTSSPSNPLSVEATNASDWVAEFKQGHSTTGQSYGVNIQGGTNASDASFQASNQSGTTLFRVRGDGSVGIGNTSLTGKLSVEATGNHLFLRASTATAGKYWNFDVTSNNQLFFLNNDSSASFTIKDDNTVGIGTSSPTSGNRLHIKDSDTQIELEATGSGTSNSGFVNFDGTSLQLSTNRDNKTGTFHDTAKSNASVLLVGSDGGSHIRFNTAAANNTTSTERMRILAGGNVGIGTTTPSQKLTVVGNTFVSSGILLLSDNQDIRWGDAGERITGHNTNGLIFTTNNSEVMRIDSSGRVGIGVTPETWTVWTPIQIGLSSVFAGRISINQTDVANNWYYDGSEKRINGGFAQRYVQDVNGDHYWMVGASGSAESTISFSTPMIIKNSGNIGFGTTSPDSNLQIANNDGSSYRFGFGGSSDVYLDADNVYIRTDNGGANTATFTTSGLGIGTITPESTLSLKGNQSALDFTRGTSGDSHWYFSSDSGKFYIGRDSIQGSDAVMVFHSGSDAVGIGTTSPSGKLHVSSADSNTVFILGNTGTGGVDWAMYSANNGSANAVAGGDLLFRNASSNVLILQNDGDVLMNAGNVGIGTTSPSSLLHLENASSPALQIKDTTNNVTFKAYSQNTNAHVGTTSNHDLIFDTNNTERMRISNGGDISMTLNSDGVGRFIDNVGEVGSGTFALQVTNDANAALKPLGFRAEDIRFATGNSERVRIDSSGNVGIGNTSPASISSTARWLSLNADNGSSASGGVIYQVDGTTKAATYAFGDNVYHDAKAGVGHQFAVNNGTVAMVVNTNGRVGIGLTSASGLLHVKGDTNDNGGELFLQVNNNNTTDNIGAINFGNNADTTLSKILSGTSGNNTSSYLTFSTSATGTQAEAMRINSNGDLLIGTTDNISGTNGGAEFLAGESGNRSILRLATENTTANDLIVFFNPNGVVGRIRTEASATSYLTSSDYRLKENVVEMTGSLDRIDQLKPSRFNFIADADRTVDGFLAHEVANVVPEAIDGVKDGLDENGNPYYQSIDNSKLVPLLVGAIQELKAEIERLKNQ